MISPDFSPPVAPALSPIEDVSRARHDQKQLESVAQQLEATEKALTPEEQRKRAFEAKLGHIAMGFAGDQEVINDPSLAPANKREVKQEKAAKRKAERLKDRQATQSLRETTTGTENSGSKRKVRSAVKVIKTRVATRGASYEDQNKAIYKAKSEPVRKKTHYQKTVERSTRAADRKVDSVKSVKISEPKNAAGREREADRLGDERNILQLLHDFTEMDTEVNAAARSYNKDVKKTNKLRNSYIRGVKRSARLDRGIDRIERSRVGSTRPVRGVSRAISGVRDKNELRVQKAERQGADIRANARQKLSQYEQLRDTNAARKQEITDYLNSIETISINDAIDLLSYVDTAPAGDHARLTEHTRTSESGMKYARELRSLVKSEGSAVLLAAADQAIQIARNKLTAVGLTPSHFGESRSWLLWDLAKQMYYFKHPDQADPNYRNVNPLEDVTKQQEMIDRHVGWEIYTKYINLPFSDRDKFIADHDLGTSEVITLLNTAPNSSNTLSSKDLAALGSLIR